MAMEGRRGHSFVPLLLLILSVVCGWVSATVPLEHVDSNATVTNAKNMDNSSSDAVPTGCSVSAVDKYLPNTIRQLLKVDRVSLIKYSLYFSNYTTNPLTGNTTQAYKLDKWSRVTTEQGQTLLSLAFNYGVLSMATLTLGTEELNVDLVDHPPGCIGLASEAEKVNSIKYLMVRDFQNASLPSLTEQERVCHEFIYANEGYAMFRDRCYYKDPNTGVIIEDNDPENIWLTILYVLLFIVRYTLIFFGPCMFITFVERMQTEQIPYVVKLKDTFVKTIFITTSKSPSLTQPIKYEHMVDLSGLKGFPKLHDCVNQNRSLVARPVKVKFTQYDITVNYRRLLTENMVQVGLLPSLYNAIFQCNIRAVGPFKYCCHTNLLQGCPFTERKVPWIKFWRKVAKVSMILLIPIPYYIRLIIYYLCEHEEIMLRKSFIERAGLREKYETTSSLMHYLTPTHPLFITIYVIYALTALLLVVLPKKKREGRLLKIIVGSFRDLKTLSWTETLSMVTSNVIWPFKRFGMLGCLVCLVYWPIALPLTLIIATIYSIPTIYLTLRMAFYSKSAIIERMRRRKKNKPYQINTKTDKDMHQFEFEILLPKQDDITAQKPSAECMNEIALDEIDYVKPPHLKNPKDTISLASSIVKYSTTSCRRLVTYVATAVICIATLYAVMIILSEVIGCFVEVVVFTIMGVIVNASALLKYVMLILMIFVYCCDCFNNMEKKYLKLNKALFAEVKGRIKNLSDVTSLPSFLQENHGFKSQELGEQAFYESPDDIADKPLNHWIINDLVMFVDSEDMPRIPKQLFEEVCQIRVAGVPGPVFRGLIEAVEQLLKIVVFIIFVFIVVLTFGSVYKVSNTNQMLAAMVGGFLPLVLKTFMAPPAPDIEIGTVSFKNKLDEVIKNFCQYWPIYDLPFTVITEEEELEEQKKKMDAAAPAPEVSMPVTEDDSGDATAADNDATAAQTAYAFFSQPDSEYGAIVPLLSRTGQSSAEGNNNAHVAENRTKESTKPDSNLKTTRFTEPPVSDDQTQTKVDILIYMPNKDFVWLDEWSDTASVAR